MEPTIGLARYEPGWRWSEHVGPAVGAELRDVEHLRVVLSGHARVRRPSADAVAERWD